MYKCELKQRENPRIPLEEKKEKKSNSGESLVNLARVYVYVIHHARDSRSRVIAADIPADHPRITVTREVPV